MNEVKFIKVSGKRGGYDKAKTDYPSGLIFYQGRTEWIIYADGHEYNFSSSPSFLKVCEEIQNIKGDINEINETLRNKFVKYTDIDTTTNNNGAILKLFADGTIQSSINLATQSENGAMSATDKQKLDSLDWVIL